MQGDLDNLPDQRCFGLSSPMSFSLSLYNLQPSQSSNYDMDDIMLNPEVSSTSHSKSDMLKLEELLDDSSFECVEYL